MADLTKIAASLAAPSLSSALQEAGALPSGQTIDAKIAQILSDGLLKLTSSIGTFELKASHPALQPGVNVRLTISDSGAITLTLAPKADALAPQLSQAPAQASHPAQQTPAVITTLSGSQNPAQPAAPSTYTATGQIAQQTQPEFIPASSPQNVPQASQPLQPNISGTLSPTIPAQTKTAAIQTPAQILSPPPVTQQAGAASYATQPEAALPQPNAATQLVTPQQASAQPILPQAILPEAPQPSSATPQISVTPALPAALGEALGEALAKAGSIAPLIANLDAVEKLAKPLPEPLRVAIGQVLQSIKPFSDNIAPQTLEQAVKRAGIFFENDLAKGLVQAFLPDAPQPDLKAALLKLEAALKSLPTPEASPKTRDMSDAPRPAPPRPNELPQPQPRREATLTSSSTIPEITAVLTQQTDSALARVRVLQFASLPVGADAPGGEQVRPAQVWHLDIPLLINGQANIIPLQIERDAEKRAAAEHHHRWRVRFALDLAELGAVHALLALGGGMLDITLWAEREETCTLFNSMAKELHYALLDEELDVTGIRLSRGPPAHGFARGWTCGYAHMSEKEEKEQVAVALHYQHPGTPKVVAKGTGAVAENIIRTAQEHDVAVEKNPELAAALSTVELDENIPVELYKAVAQVIGFVMKAAKKAKWKA